MSAIASANTDQSVWVDYVADWRHAPMAFWVHQPVNDPDWRGATRYDPPAPLAVPHRGYPLLCIQIGDVTLQFSSRAQLSECVRVLSLVPLPTSARLSQLRDGKMGPNTHWLSRLPAKLKSKKGRALVVKRLEQVLAAGALPFSD